MKQHIKLMADYYCFPLWHEIDSTGNIDPCSLDLSSDIIEKLSLWSNKFDQTLNRDDPYLSGFSTELESEEFDKFGHQLLSELKTQLGDKYIVRYCN